MRETITTELIGVGPLAAFEFGGITEGVGISLPDTVTETPSRGIVRMPSNGCRGFEFTLCANTGLSNWGFVLAGVIASVVVFG